MRASGRACGRSIARSSKRTCERASERASDSVVASVRASVRARVRTSESASDRANVRVNERAGVLASERAFERAGERAFERASERQSVRAFERASVRSSECLSERASASVLVSVQASVRVSVQASERARRRRGGPGHCWRRARLSLGTCAPSSALVVLWRRRRGRAATVQQGDVYAPRHGGRVVKAGIRCSFGSGRRGFDPLQPRRTKRASFHRWRFEMKLSSFVLVGAERGWTRRTRTRMASTAQQWAAMEAVNTASAVALVSVAPGPAHCPGSQARRAALRAAGGGGARLVLGGTGARG